MNKHLYTEAYVASGSNDGQRKFAENSASLAAHWAIASALRAGGLSHGD